MSSGPAVFDPEQLDLLRMRTYRHGRIQEQMERAGVGVVVLLGSSAVQYSTGAAAIVGDSSRGTYQRSVAVVVAGDPLPHLFTPYPEGAPPELEGDHLHPPLYLDVEEGVDTLTEHVLALTDGHPPGSVALDDQTPAMCFGDLERRLGGAPLSEASSVMAPAKLLKCPDELECIRRAQRINELAMYDVYEALHPGVRQSELTGLFLRRIFELGASNNAVDPIWTAMAPSLAEGPFTTHGDVAYPLVTTDRLLREGEVVWVDTGIGYHGYASDFGRTWIVSEEPRPDASQLDQYRRWREVVDATLDVVRPGATGGDLTKAAIKANQGERPWLDHFYLIHGVGTDSAELPLVGTDLGPDFDEGLVLAPGMVMVLEPVIWDDGHAGYRSEDIVAVTDDAYRMLSDHPYTPYD